MENIIFTGITGELGRALIPTLLNKKKECIFFIRKPQSAYSIDFSGFRVLDTNITDRKSIFRYSESLKNKVDTLVHMATARPNSKERDLFNTIVKGSVNLYEFANEIRCPKFVYLSSIAAAGWVPNGMECIDETFVPSQKRLRSFGKMKLEADYHFFK